MDPRKYHKNRMSLENIATGDLFFVFDSHGRLHTNFTVLRKDIRSNCLTLGGESVVEVDIRNSQPFFLAALIWSDPANRESSEIKRFVESASLGLIYDEVQEAGITVSRDEAKTAVYVVLFGRNGSSGPNVGFQSIYPEVYDWVVEFKRSAGDYRALSHRLQRMESDLIYGRVLPRVYEALPGVPLFTVHDSIVCPARHRAIVAGILTEELATVLG